MLSDGRDWEKDTGDVDYKLCVCFVPIPDAHKGAWVSESRRSDNSVYVITSLINLQDETSGEIDYPSFGVDL